MNERKAAGATINRSQKRVVAVIRSVRQTPVCGIVCAQTFFDGWVCILPTTGMRLLCPINHFTSMQSDHRPQDLRNGKHDTLQTATQTMPCFTWNNMKKDIAHTGYLITCMLTPTLVRRQSLPSRDRAKLNV